jgi:tRNA (guanine37-N1)-methyltransferase
MSPRGKTYNEKTAQSFSKLGDLLIVCGHYEGIDERVNDYVDELISIGDYVLTGGEIPAMAISDSVIRLLDGAIASESLQDESFNANLLEYPQYTEPYDYDGSKRFRTFYTLEIMPRLKSGDGSNRFLLTKKYRPDLFNKLTLTKQDKKLLDEDPDETPKWESDAIAKGHKFIKK